MALVALVGALALAASFRIGREEQTAITAPARPAAKMPVKAPAAPPTPKQEPVSAAPDRLHGGRSAAWWRDRLALLAGRSDPESARLHAVMLGRATRLGIAGITGSAETASAPAAPPTQRTP